MKLGRALAALVVLGLGEAGYLFAGGASDKGATAATDKARLAQPSVEQLFIAAASKARDAYNQASSKMAKGAARAARAIDVCNALASVDANGWTGVVASQSINRDGMGVLSVKIGPSVRVKTWNNMTLDSSDETLIEPNTRLFAKTAALKEGSPVRFSGSFKADSLDCIKETSLTIRGSLTDPEYLFRFTDITELR